MEKLDEMQTIEKIKWLRDNRKVKDLEGLKWLQKQADRNINDLKLKRKAKIMLEEIKLDLEDEEDTEEFFMPPIFDESKGEYISKSENYTYSYQNREPEEPKPIYQKSFRELGQDIKQISRITKESIKYRSRNIDKEKMKERADSTVKVLSYFMELAVKVISAVYKLPTKRHFKKAVSYKIDDMTQKYSGNGMIDEGNNILKHHFYVDYLPKLLVAAGGFLVFVTSATGLGLMLMFTGLIYYLFTLLIFTYEDNALLNHIADLHEKEGIRLKDAYYNHILVLYQYFLEYQQALGITIDMSKQFRTEWDKDFGTLLYFTIKEDRQKIITSLSDHLITYYKVVPLIDPYQKKLKIQQNRVSVVMLDQILLSAIDKDENVSELFAQKVEYLNYFTELREIAEMQKQQAIEEERRKQQQEFKQKVSQLVSERGLNNRTINILEIIQKKKEEWKFNSWKIGENGLKGNDIYIQIRCRFLQDGNIKTINNLKNQIESQFRSQILVKPLQDRGSFSLYVLFEPTLDMYAMKVADVQEYNEQDKVFIGQSMTGPLTADWNYNANHMVVGGKSGSGKSVQIINVLTQLSYLESFKYRRMYITSSSKIGDFTPFAEKGALVTSGVEKQEKVFEHVLKKLEEREELFFKSGVSNIKEYNKKYPDDSMEFIVLLADEWENSRGTLDTKLAKRLEGLIVQILNIARSSGCLVMIGAQSILKGDIGTVVDKMFVKYSGSNNKNILNTIDPEIANYYSTLDRKPQGVFFYSSENTPATEESLFFGDTNYTLIQTPYLTDIEPRNLPVLLGAEEEKAILSGEDVELSTVETETLDTADITAEDIGVEEENNDIIDIYDI